MGEKIYKTMKNCGVWNIALGIVVIAVGVSTGVGMIINGCILLKRKSELTF
jgi:hypothetical protein